jgi:hypothetical protein
MTMYTPRGDEMRFKSADNVDNLYGPDARAVVFEEFTRAKNMLDAFMALRSTLTATRGKMKLIGNYIGESNPGHQLLLANRNNAEWAHFMVPATKAVEAGILDGAEVDQAREDLPPWRFLALYMCQGSAHPLQMMTSTAINDLWTNTVEPGDRVIVVDVAGHGIDRTVVSEWNGLLMTNVRVLDMERVDDIAKAVAQIAKANGVRRSNIVVDVGGVGSGVGDLLPGCYRFNGSNRPIDHKKDMAYGNLRAQVHDELADAVNTGRMAIAAECEDYRDDISIELEVVRRRKDVTDTKFYVIEKIKIKEAIGRSPDIGDTMAMRMVLELKAPTTTFEKAMMDKGDRFRREEFKRILNETFGHMDPTQGRGEM